MSQQNGAVNAALGSVIGYIGAEIAGPLLFERLLWPSRFYNDLTPWIALKLAIFMPMGGPLHRAALQTIDVFRRNRLYLGPLEGDMLGSAFFPDTKTSYYSQSGPSLNIRKEARNMLWILALDGAKYPDVEVQSRPRPGQSRKTTCDLFHLKLERCTDSDSPQSSDVAVVQEDAGAIKTVAGILISEITAIMIAIFVEVVWKNRWLPALLCAPIALKLLAFFVRVQRHGITTRMSDDLVQKFGDPDDVMLFKLENGNSTFILVEAPPRQFLPFVLHYGHPLRRGGRHTESAKYRIWLGRVQEIMSILIVYMFALIFPAGLFALIWLPTGLQYVWLGYQIYVTLAMHVSRLAGLDGSGRTEERISRYFRAGKSVILRSHNGAAVRAQLTVSSYASVRDGTAAMDRLINTHII